MEYRLNIKFDDRDDENLDKINAMLAALPLTGCELADEAAYTFTRTVTDNKTGTETVSYGFGFDSVTVIGKREEYEEAHIFRMDTAAFPLSENVSQNQFEEMWKKAHPNQVIRMLQCWQFTEKNAFVVLCHEKSE